LICKIAHTLAELHKKYEVDHKELVQAVKNLYDVIEEVFDQHVGIKGYTVYLCTNYIDVRLCKLIDYAMSRADVNVPSHAWHKVEQDGMYFLPTSGWYKLNTTVDNMRTIVKMLMTK
jgi:hypothetical protein